MKTSLQVKQVIARGVRRMRSAGQERGTKKLRRWDKWSKWNKYIQGRNCRRVGHQKKHPGEENCYMWHGTPTFWRAPPGKWCLRCRAYFFCHLNNERPVHIYRCKKCNTVHGVFLRTVSYAVHMHLSGIRRCPGRRPDLRENCKKCRPRHSTKNGREWTVND